MTTGYIFDERFLGHDTGEQLIELPDGSTLEPIEHSSAARITRRSHTLISGSGLLPALARVTPRPATVDDLALFHTPAHVERIRALCAGGGGEAGTNETGDATPVVPASWDAALLSAGAVLSAVDAVIGGQVQNIYALVRPPGHHATADQSMGYCVFNNVAIAARYARRDHGLRRIMIVDWDVHHGNGTQSAFYNDPGTLFISLHQDGWYPLDAGNAGDVGSGAAAGTTVNIPLPAGTGDIGYLEAFERVIGPIGRLFQPELIFISAGQDPSMVDPLGRMMVTMDGFRALATFLRELAGELCGGRLVAVQEGGYSASYVPFCTLAAVEGLMGARSAVRDPHHDSSELIVSQREYRPQQGAAIDAVLDAQRPYWHL
jgi:acetoin utilization deacetylase AcuC-like enzyme